MRTGRQARSLSALGTACAPVSSMSALGVKRVIQPAEPGGTMIDPKLTRRHLLAGAGALAGATTLGYFGATLAQNGTPVAVGNATPGAATPLATPVTQPTSTAEWPFYGHTIEGTKFTNVSTIA